MAKLFIVVAMTSQGVIGVGNSIPWNIPSDLRRFKHITTKVGTVIVGRKTWESIPEKYRPLSDRHSIILSRGNIASPANGVVQVVTSLENALDVVRVHGGRACVIGGEEIYRLFLPYAQVICATIVTAPDLVGDAYFPVVDRNDWEARVAIRGIKHSGDQYRTSYFEYHRR